MSEFSSEFRKFLGLAEPMAIKARLLASTKESGFVRELIEYPDDAGHRIPAFLFVPDGDDVVGGVVIFHQHNSQFHLGKSEVAGLAGDPLQAFGPALARTGFAVLAPDAVTFEERRAKGTGVEHHEDDWLQHVNGMGHRLVEGDLLMRKSLDDAQRALSVLTRHARVDSSRIGVAGHSYGGTTALYHAAVDSRVRFACASGSVVSFARRQHDGTGINMMELVPGITQRWEMSDIVGAVAPRPLLVASATDDRYSADAAEVIDRVDAQSGIQHLRAQGSHALDRERFESIVAWLKAQSRADDSTTARRTD